MHGVEWRQGGKGPKADMNTMGNQTMLESELDCELQATGHARRVLLAEDDPHVRAVLAWVLLEQGFDVVQAADGLDVLSYLEPRFLDARMHGRILDVDLVLSDLRLPGCSGMDILSNLRLHDREMPFILVTAFGDELTRSQARDLGAALVIDKPFDIDDVVRAVRGVLPPAIDA
jgi:DNA-binding response OmpR family regulator